MKEGIISFIITLICLVIIMSFFSWMGSGLNERKEIYKEKQIEILKEQKQIILECIKKTKNPDWCIDNFLK